MKIIALGLFVAAMFGLVILAMYLKEKERAKAKLVKELKGYPQDRVERMAKGLELTSPERRKAARTIVNERRKQTTK